MPSRKDDVNLEKYKAQIENVADGVRFCWVKTQAFKTAYLGFSMAMPLEGDVEAKAILPFLLRRSCRKYPDFTQLNARLAELYGASLSGGISKRGEAQFLSLSVVALDDRFSLDGESVALSCAELLLDLVFDPNVKDGTFLDDDMKREKRLLAEKISSEKNNKRAYAQRRCEALMCENEKFGLNPLGEKDKVLALEGKAVYAAWQNMLKTAQIQITMVGSADSDVVAKALKERFENIERQPLGIETQFIKSADSPRYFSEEMAVEQGKLVLGFRAGMENEDDNNDAIRLMTYLYGGSPHSKLFLNVREKMSLSYYCSSAFSRSKGLIWVQSGIDTDKEEAAKTAILDQLEAVKNGDISEEEIKTAKLGMIDGLRGVEDSPEAIAAWYDNQLLKDDFTTPHVEAGKIEAVTLEEIISAAKGVTLDTVYMLKGTLEGESHED